MADFLLGIDLGTSSVRAGIFHTDGTCAALAARNYPIHSPSTVIAEQDPELWWKGTCEAIREGLNTAHIRGSDIRGISFSGQMHGTVLLDSTGHHIAKAIIWADSRSTSELQEIQELIGANVFSSIVLNRIFPGTQATTLFWLKKHSPDTWRRIRHVLLPKDYLRYRMCGLYHSEPSDASATLLFDLSLREWSLTILKILGIPIEFLPFIVHSDQYIGETEGIEETTGIPDGIPVVLGGGDQPVAALGNGVLDEGTMFVAVGTGAQIVTPISRPLGSPGLSLNTFCHLPETRWYIMGATLAGGLCLRWFRDTFCPGIPFESLSNEASQTPDGADGLVFTPYLNGKRSPELDPKATGTFSNIRLMHSRAHFVRAIMEGVVFEIKESFQIMKEMGVNPMQLIASGGFTKSPVWMQIMADSLGMTLHVSEVKEQSCFGAALLAGIGTGVYASYWKALEVIPKPVLTVEPGTKNRELYEEKYELYKKEYQKQTQ